MSVSGGRTASACPHPPSLRSATAPGRDIVYGLRPASSFVLVPRGWAWLRSRTEKRARFAAKPGFCMRRIGSKTHLCKTASMPVRAWGHRPEAVCVSPKDGRYASHKSVAGRFRVPHNASFSDRHGLPTGGPRHGDRASMPGPTPLRGGPLGTLPLRGRAPTPPPSVKTGGVFQVKRF